MTDHAKPDRRSPTHGRLVALAAFALALPHAHASAQTMVHANDAELIVRIPYERAFPIGVFHLGVVVAAPDIDGDGVPDFFLTAESTFVSDGSAQPGRVVLFSGATGGEVWDASGIGVTDRFGRSVTMVHDIDGDGVFDVAVGEFGFGRVALLSGATGARIGAISPPVTEVSSFAYSIAALRDASGGATRLAVGSPRLGRGYVYSLMDAPPPPIVLYPADTSFPLFGVWTTNIGDVDGDGVDDVVMTEPDFLRASFIRSGATGETLYEIWNRDLSFGESVSVSPDLDGDGVTDMYIASHATVRAHSGATGAPRFSMYFAESDLNRSVLGVGDVDGDGVPDFAVGNPFYPPDDGVSPDPKDLAIGRVQLFSGRTRQLIREYSGAAPYTRLGHSLAAVPNAAGDGRTAIVARAFRGGDDPSVTGAYAYVFVAPAPCLADTNYDRVINASDLSTVLASYGASGPLPGDVNFDGVVDFLDFQIVLSRYGASCE